MNDYYWPRFIIRAVKIAVAVSCGDIDCLGSSVLILLLLSCIIVCTLCQFSLCNVMHSQFCDCRFLKLQRLSCYYCCCSCYLLIYCTVGHYTKLSCITFQAESHYSFMYILHVLYFDDLWILCINLLWHCSCILANQHMLLVVSKLLSLLVFFVELNFHLLIVIPDYCKCKRGSHGPQTLPPVLPPGGYFKHTPFSCRYMRRDIIYLFIY